MRTHTQPQLPGTGPCAGFPSPAQDHSENRLDLNGHLVRNPAATYFVRVRGGSMSGEGIFHGDLLVVDRSVEPRAGHVVVAAVDGEFALRRIERRDGALVLASGDASRPDVPLGREDGVEIWGVALSVIHRLTPCSTR